MSPELPELSPDENLVFSNTLVELILRDRPRPSLTPYLHFMFISDPDVPRSGFANSACDTSKIQVYELYPGLTLPLLQALLNCGTKVEDIDVRLAMTKFNKDHTPLLKLLIDKCQDKKLLNWDELCCHAIKKQITPFVTLLIGYGAKPDPNDVMQIVDHKKMNTKLGAYIVYNGSVELRTQLLKEALASGNAEMARIALDSGEIDPSTIDLSSCITSPAIVRNGELLGKLLQTGVTPNGIKDEKAMSLVLQLKSLSRDQQAHVVLRLLEYGGDISQLSSAYEEPMSPVHAATKLTLETGQ